MSKRQPKQLKEYLSKIGYKYTIDELLNDVNNKFNCNYTKHNLRCYMTRHNLKYKFVAPHNSHNMKNKKQVYDINDEVIKKNGRVYIKVENNKWVVKSRYLYEKYHNVKLTKDDVVIFLDNDKTNYSKDNLKVVPREYTGYLYNFDLTSTDKKITELGVDVARLMIKTKRQEKDYEKLQQRTL